MASIRATTAADWPQIAKIYREGVEMGNATLETTVPAYERWNAAHVQECRLVAVVDGTVTDEGIVAGWAAFSPVGSRCVYGGVAGYCVKSRPPA